MLSSLALLSFALGASAAPSSQITPRQAQGISTTSPALLLLGGPATVAAATFDGASFNIVANDSRPGTGASWLLFKEPNLLYAVDENSNTTRLFSFDNTTNALTLVQNATGSSGVVSLEFNLQRDRIVGAAFGQGQIDIWDVSAPDGSLTLLKQIPSNDALGPNKARQDKPHPHQALLENSGRFFVVNDLGTDTILVIDSLDDTFEVVNHVRVPAEIAGCGPRHGAFYPGKGADFPTSYLLVCEMLNLVQVFQLEYTDGNVTFTPTQTISTFGDASPPLNASSATAGEIQVSADNQQVFVSNRNTGNETDSISVFSVTGAQSSAGAQLTFVQSISSQGKVPRMFSLSEDAGETKLFTANQDGALGLVALDKSEDGQLSVAAAPVGLSLEVFGAAGLGPQFVQQIF